MIIDRIRYRQEFEPLTILPTPLLANFTYRGDYKSDKLTGAMNRIVSEETEYRISAVDVEADEEDVQELLSRYSVCISMCLISFYNCMNGMKCLIS